MYLDGAHQLAYIKSLQLKIAQYRGELDILKEQIKDQRDWLSIVYKQKQDLEADIYELEVFFNKFLKEKETQEKEWNSKIVSYHAEIHRLEWEITRKNDELGSIKIVNIDKNKAIENEHKKALWEIISNIGEKEQELIEIESKISKHKEEMRIEKEEIKKQRQYCEDLQGKLKQKEERLNAYKRLLHSKAKE